MRLAGVNISGVKWCTESLELILGPILWNVVYDRVLRGSDLPGMSVVCNADVILLMSRRKSYVGAPLVEVGITHNAA